MKINVYVNGEEICKLVRDLFWVENLGYDECEEILMECLDDSKISLQEKQVIIQNIIEGRSKLVGTNVFSLVDDNSNIRLLSSKLKKNKENEMINQIRLDMISNPYNYIDPFSTVKSISSFDERRIVNCDFNELYRYFACNKDGEEYKSFSKSTKCGLWLIGDAEFVFDVYGKPIPCKTSEDEYADFWNKVYQKIKDDKDFLDRNKNYLHKVHEKQETLERIKKILNNKFEKNENNDSEFTNDSNNVPTGIVYSNGIFAPCEFGGHECLAKRICDYHKIRLNKNKSYLDTLIKQGFISLRSLPNVGYYVSFNDLNNITNEQFKTIFDIEKEFNIKFKFNTDEYKEIFKNE